MKRKVEKTFLLLIQNPLPNNRESKFDILEKKELLGAHIMYGKNYSQFVGCL